MAVLEIRLGLVEVQIALKYMLSSITGMVFSQM